MQPPKQIVSRQTVNAPPPPALVIQSIVAAKKPIIEKEVSPPLDDQTSLFNGPNPFSKLLMSPPTITTNNSNEILDLLATSYRNIPQPWDQEVNVPVNPVREESPMLPTLPMFNRRENFSKFDLDTLFFSFYYQQGTYQQYLAAMELKKKNWRFHRKYHTWFKKTSNEGLNRYVYFDYESSWS